MDRMTPPPNYYGAPYPNFNQNMPNPQMQGPQPPMPNGINPNQQQQIQPQQPSGYEEAIFMEKGPLNVQQNNDQICMNYTYADIAQANRGKKVKVFCSFTDASEWHDVTFEGRILYGAVDHIAIESEDNPSHYMVILGVYIDYMMFFDKPNVPAKRSI
ncbi:MAG: spore coat protein GerQ [Erysipelotrichales bacterium]|nr:spore coat protein GerQ [Erysipelotrichales bacterium]